jgi:hypothetical protein
MSKRARTDTITGRLRAADPFELIRWLARSQPDPRKALAELVQNSLDAAARTVRITRLRERGVTALHILDDGEGVIPEMERTEALTYIATHVGHSRKRNLTPEQRRELMMQGKYGIGLLGFWSIGQLLEMRTQLPRAPAWLLRLHEDSPHYEIERLRARLSFGERYTEIVIRALHRPAFLSLSGRRMADYLAAELRGQLLARDVKIFVHDKIARGRAPKLLEVKPARFEGERLRLPEEIHVERFSPIRLELYVLPSGYPEEGRVAVSSAGTIVYDDIADFESADFRHPPWTDRRITGLIEFADFQVAPGTRRGVIPDHAALAFAAALRTVEPLIQEQLRAEEQRAAAELEADLLRQLKRAFRDVPRLAPEYDFFAVHEPGPGALQPEARGASEGGQEGVATPEELPSGVSLLEASPEDHEPELLLPAGLLASVRIVPRQSKMERLGARQLRAEARDSSGTLIRRDVEMKWTVPSPLAYLEPGAGQVVTLHAGFETGTVAVTVNATEGQQTVSAEASVEIVDSLESDSARSGIPEPVFVDEPASDWRSRMRDGRWEVNGAHPDFRIAADSSRRKLRYLTALLAKEIVLHSFPAPQLGPALERLVAVLTITERRLERG